jgi:hypothetical protein
MEVKFRKLSNLDMDFFYQRRSVTTCISINPSGHDTSQFYDRIHVRTDILNALSLQESDRFAFSISPVTRPASGFLKHFDSLVCWAVVDNDMVRMCLDINLSVQTSPEANRFDCSFILGQSIRLPTFHLTMETTIVNY